MAAVTVNGELMGSYTHIESIKKRFLDEIYGARRSIHIEVAYFLEQPELCFVLLAANVETEVLITIPY